MDNGNEMSSSLTFASSSYLSNGSSSQNLSAAATGCSNLDNLSLNKLSANLEKLLIDSEYEYSDAEIVVEDIPVGVHRSILAARSQFFHQLFKRGNGGEVKEGKPRYSMSDLVPYGRVGYEAFNVFLSYLYTGKLKPSPPDVSTCVDDDCAHDACRPAINYAVELMYASATFQMKELVLVVQRRLLNFVDKALVEDVIPILVAAFHCQLNQLLSHCIHRVERSDLDNISLEKELPYEVSKEIISLRLKSRQEAELIVPEVVMDPLHEKRIRRIHKALDSDDVELVKMLLSESNITLDQAYALHYAAAYCDPKIVKEVLNLNSADLNCRNGRGYTILHVAARRKEPSILVALLHKGASASESTLDGQTAVAICRRLTRPKDYNEKTNQGQESNKDKLCIDVLEREMRGSSKPVNMAISSQVIADDLNMKLHYYENRVAFARLLFPAEARVAMLNHTNNLLTKAISKLEDEFRQLLTNYSKPVEPDRLFDCLPNSLRPSSAASSQQSDVSSKGHSEHQNKSLENAVYTLPTLIPPRVLPLLHDLAQQMVKAGHQQQLFRIYRDTRASVLEQSLRKLGVERLTKDDVQKMQWEVLEAKIGNWIHYMRIAVKLLFAGEKNICDQIFDGVDSLRDQCFADVTSNSVSVLLSFGEAIARSKRSPEKLFVLLDMYEIMRELQSEMETLFGSKYCNEMRESSVSLTKRLAQTAQETFGDFEEAVEKDATKTSVFDGTVHPLTSYVINYVKFLFDYQSTLKQLFQEFDSRNPEAQLASVTTRIMQALQNNLDGKSKQYKDSALTQLFLMNNIHYIVRSVRRSEAKDLLGDDWVQIHRRIVQQHANQYKRVSWAKILQCLTVQASNSSGGGGPIGGDGSGSQLSRAGVKDRFKTFNVQFEEIHQRQSQWTVPDSELRESLRLAVAEVLLPAYRSFLRRHGPQIESGKNPQKYIRYTPEDLEHMLGEFFEGKTWNEQKR